MSDFLKHLMLPQDYDKHSGEVRLRLLINVMNEIYRSNLNRDLRSRYSTEEQFLEEYGEDPERDLAIAWTFLKKAYLKYEAEFVLLRDKLEKHQQTYFDIMKKICDNEAEANFLLEDEEDEGN